MNRALHAPILIGRILGPRGLGGELRLQLFRDDPKYFSAGRLLVDGAELGLARAQADGKKRYIVALEGVGDRSAAEARQGQEVAVLPSWFGADGPLELLLGARVQDAESGAELGIVAGLDHNGAQDLLELERPEGARALIPYVPAFVAGVELAQDGARVLRLRLIEGLLEA